MEEKKVQADTRHRPRSLAILQSIYRAISAYPGTLPNVEFTLTLHDEAARVGTEQVEHTTWAFSRRAQEEQLWLMPDFGTKSKIYLSIKLTVRRHVGLG